MMDPQDFIRLSVGSLGLRIPVSASKAVKGASHVSASPCRCEIRLRGFPIQTAQVPLISSSSEANPGAHSNPIVFYLEKSDVKAQTASGCFQTPQPFLEVAVYLGRKKGLVCSITSRKRQLGSFRVEVSPEWGEGKPLLIHSGWIEIGKHKQAAGRPRPELHLRVKLDPDPRYVFQFEDETLSSPQIVQLQGNIRQPIFSCKFSRHRRASQLDPLGAYWSASNDEDQDGERRERKGWKVMIHDLSGSAAAAAFISTPFVPSTGCDRVAQSNPGAWLIVRPDPAGTSKSWHPWGRLEAWREIGVHHSVCLRLFLLPEGQEAGVLVSEVLISTDKGGEFFIDMDRQTPVGTPVNSPKGAGAEGFGMTVASSVGGAAAEVGGFVMNCKVQGEGKSSKPLVQLAMCHVTCVEDAAIFMALAAAVDLSIEACKPFRRKAKKLDIRHSLLSS